MTCITNGVARGTEVMCSLCKGFYKKEYFYRHRKHCLNATKVTLTATSSSPMPTAEPDEEWGHVLEGKKQDSAYITITGDEVIKVSGRDIFAARKPNKKLEAMVMARRAMRRVARLKQAVRVNSSQELFFIENIREVELAMNNMCSVEENLKEGLKLANPLVSIHFPFTIIPESPQPLSQPCPFSDRSVPDLRRHFITTHKHNDRVKAIVDDGSSDRISKQLRMYAFDQLKMEGI